MLRREKIRLLGSSTLHPTSLTVASRLASPFLEALFQIENSQPQIRLERSLPTDARWLYNPPGETKMRQKESNMAETKKPIYSPIHTDHGLLSPAKAKDNFACSACKVKVKEGNRIYQCCEPRCDFKIHELCAKTHDCEEAPHIQHKHKLYRKLKMPTGDLKLCIVCRKPIEGIRYWCPVKSCRDVIVHPLCSRVMPCKLHEHVPDVAPVTDKQVFHSIHDPSHGPLTYRRANGDFECGACKLKVEGRRSMYHCSTCNFTMHKVCATLREKAVTHTPHKQHKLKQILEKPKGDSLPCNKCSKPVRGIRYACQDANCSNIVVHPTCLEIPQEKPKNHKPK
ncbi:hypothetical protein EJB05_02095, partial [Eragrostis curvula]